jgi:cytochrome c-type biogenesis protein CcmH
MAGLDRGESDSLVLQAFEQKYGTAVIAAPASTGFSLVAWIMPFLVLVLGCVGTVLLVRAWKKRPAAARSGVTPVGGADLELFRQKAREDTQL